MSFPFDTQGQIEAVAREVDVLQRVAGGPTGYRLRRIILVNFWLYGLQIFEIPHGRLLLTGKNASGKSTVLTAALPLALEGSLRPERLDTFGGKHKHVDYYVLGDEGSPTSFACKKRTAYIALEFERCPTVVPTNEEAPDLEPFFSAQTEQHKSCYLTIGISLYGNEDATQRIQPLYFLITDGSQLLKDIPLLVESNPPRAQSQHDFRESLKGHGIVCGSQEQYAQEVSNRLFHFQDTQQFEKLIELLLVIRRPNPSDKLTVPAVQQHLSDALPSIPIASAKEAVETINEIEQLQDQIDQMNQEHRAVNELHQALQTVALSKIRHAGFSMSVSQQAVEQLDRQLTQLNQDQAKLTLQLQQSEHKLVELREEKEQIAGKITAIEVGTWADATRQIITAKAQLTFASEQAERQKQQLERIQARRQLWERKIIEYTNHFQVSLEGAQHKVHDLAVRIETKALWYDAAQQFQRGLEQINRVQINGTDTATLVQETIRMTALETAPQVVWLEQLVHLHQKKQELERVITDAQHEEERQAREASRLLTKFQEELVDFYTRSRNIEQRLEHILLHADENAVEIVQLVVASPEQETLQYQVENIIVANTDGIQISIENCKTHLQQQKQSIEAILQVRSQALQKWGQELDDLRLARRQKKREIQDKERSYIEKEKQPEVVPEQAVHRTNARALLAKQGIPALPLYSLLDLVPFCEARDGAAIERMLEDAGLLDALVLLDTDIAVADSLLQTATLSDCRIDNAQLQQLAHTKFRETSTTARWLQFDPTIHELFPTTSAQWEETILRLIPLLEALFTPSLEHANTTQPARDTSATGLVWQHGLLKGQSCKDQVQFLGRTARQHARQQELATLALEITTLQGNLEALEQQLTQRTARFEKFSTEQDEMRTLVERMGLSVAQDILQNTGSALTNTQKRYQELQDQTRKRRQEHNRLLMTIVEQSGPIVDFAHSSEKVVRALHEVYVLGPEAQTLRQELQALLHFSEEWQELQSSLQDIITDEQENQTTYATLHEQEAHQQAIVAGLQEIVDAPEAQNLMQKLELLHIRAKQVAEDILKVTGDLGTFTAQKNACSENSLQKEGELRNRQLEMRQRQATFADLLTIYPVPELQQIQTLVNEGAYAQAVQQMQIRVFSAERLEKEQMEALSGLNTAYQTHLRCLHDYGPELDQSTLLITFSQRNGEKPFELLGYLDSSIAKLQDLLKDREIDLFESFLLRRMTEVLHKHIHEAKEWVQQMNDSLLTMSTVKDRYELEWEAKPRSEEIKLGIHLARQHKLFSKSPIKLSDGERGLLKEAFKQEITALQQYQGNGMNFEQCLQAIFDYRQWFQFGVYITPNGGQRSRLTNKTLGERSGAERLFAVLVPLLAAITSLYKRADPDAPHLLALDEAFDRADADNTKELIEYLAAQDFQWIMTGPQLNISGTRVPAGIRYLMLHEKGTKVATAVPKIWKGNQQKD